MAKIYLDPGHGGHDPGAVGKKSNEKSNVLNVAKKLAAILREKGHTVKLSRTTDVFITLNGRASGANKWGADIFISLHNNAAVASASGFETFIYNGSTSANTKRLQSDVHNAISSKIGITDRGKKSANFAVVRQTKMPAVLVEYAFISNAKDEGILINNVDDLSQWTADGIIAYLGGKAVSNPKPSSPSKPKGKSIATMAVEVINGKHGSGHANRQKSLGISKAEYEKVRAEVNKRANAPAHENTSKTVTQMAKEVIAGKHGNGHASRQKSLRLNVATYKKVRDEVNKMTGGKSTSTSNSKQTVNQMASKIINNKNAPTGHGARRKWLGIDNATYQKVRKEVNRRL